MDKKLCSVCGTEKSIEDFGFSRPRVRRSNCKLCQGKYNQQYRSKNKEKVLQWSVNRKPRSREYRKENKEIRRVQLNEWARENPEKRRAQKYRHRYGIGLVDYEKLFVSQGGVCGICESKDVGRKLSRYFVVDHCHKSDAIRGLLCLRCNAMIGMAKDNVSVLEKAIIYLQKCRTPTIR